jgi:methylmalonyl-CoA mutase cobalamin-binding domain/chain
MRQSGSSGNHGRGIVSSSYREEELIKGLYDAVVAMDDARVRALSMSVLTEGADTDFAVRNGLMAAMEKVAELYTSDTYYVSELLLCADALHAGLEILVPHLKKDQSVKKRQIIIGTVEGDIHDVGKNIVKIMFEATGWQVHDLGKDVGPERFVDEQNRIEADIVGLSALMTTSMLAIPKAISMIKAEHPDVAVMVGGAPLTREIALGYGADGYAKDAGEALVEAKAVLERLTK